MTPDRMPMTTTLIELGAGAQLTMIGFRIYSLSKTPCKCVTGTYHDVFGCRRGIQVMKALADLSAEITRVGRRRIRLTMPGSVLLTHDEGSLLSAISAAQVGDTALRDAHLSWLLARSPSDACGERTNFLAEAMTAREFPVNAPGASAVSGAGGLTARHLVHAAGHA